MKSIFFVAGLPRSGSTLLMNILGQNNNHYVTPTSDLITLISAIKDHWVNFPSFRAAGIENVAPRIHSALKNMVHGFYEKEFQQNKIVFDKSRMWVSNIEMIEKITNEKAKIIVCIRDVRDIVASFERLHRQNPLNKHWLYGDTIPPSIFNRVQVLLSIDGTVGRPIIALRDAIARGLSDRLFIVPYLRLIFNPKETMESIHQFLGLDNFIYDFNNIEQITHEDDTIWGLPLHKIKSRIDISQVNTWEDVLPKNIADQILTEYIDICDLADYKTLKN